MVNIDISQTTQALTRRSTGSKLVGQHEHILPLCSKIGSNYKEYIDARWNLGQRFIYH